MVQLSIGTNVEPPPLHPPPFCPRSAICHHPIAGGMNPTSKDMSEYLLLWRVLHGVVGGVVGGSGGIVGGGVRWC